MRLTLSALALVLVGGIALSGIPAQAQGGGVTYKQAGEATLHYKDGVTVHRHADGSCEVSDPESAPEPLYPNQGGSSRPVRRAARKKVVTHHKATAAAAATKAKSTSTAATAKKSK